jgi:hypothetical protein
VIAFSGCATPLQIVGPYASRLSAADIQEIKVLVAKQPDTDRRLVELEATRPDKVWVKVGGFDTSGGSRYNRFIVIRRAGRWIVHPYSPAEIELSTR